MTKYLSDKITVLYTMLIIMVVYIHSYYLEAEQYETTEFIQKFIGNSFRIANCLFFSISGYLFARTIHNMKDVWKKQKKRFRTLLIPYVLWNLIFVLWYVVLEILPGLDRWVNSASVIERFATQSIGQILYYLFIEPAAFQLWFLRDLLVMVALTPVWWWLTQKGKWIAIALALASVFVYPWLVYYWLGIIIAVHRWNIEHYPHAPIATVACIIIYFGVSWMHTTGLHVPGWINALSNLAGLYALWYLYDLLVKGHAIAHKGLWKYLCGYSFFIYCFHEPAFNIIKKLPVVILGDSPAVLTFFYLINPWIMVVVAVLIAKLLQKIVPELYKILTGGR